MLTNKISSHDILKGTSMLSKSIRISVLVLILLFGVVILAWNGLTRQASAGDIQLSETLQLPLSLNAPPPNPLGIAGTVKRNGVNAPLDAVVSALCDGISYATSGIILFEDETWYSLDIPGDDPGTGGVKEGCSQGETVEFYIDELQADQTVLWSSTSYRLDLTYTAPNSVYIPLVIR